MGEIVFFLRNKYFFWISHVSFVQPLNSSSQNSSKWQENEQEQTDIDGKRYQVKINEKIFLNQVTFDIVFDN